MKEKKHMSYFFIVPMFMGIKGIWAAIPITDGIEFILAIIIMTDEYKRMRKVSANYYHIKLG